MLETEEVLISIWKQALVDHAKFVQIGAENIRFEKLQDDGSDRLILDWTIMNFVGWSKSRYRIKVGRQWQDRGRR